MKYEIELMLWASKFLSLPTFGPMIYSNKAKPLEHGRHIHEAFSVPEHEKKTK